MSMIVSIRSLRKWVLPALVALAFAGCGGDDDDQSASTPQASATTTSDTTSTTSTELEPRTETQPNDGDGNGVDTTTEPESQTGGPGDETPAQVPALFTGRNGEITPRVVKVPAYISVLVTLRGGDEAGYSLTFGKKTIRVSPGLSSVGTRLAGLKPGAKVVGVATSGQGTDAGKVTNSATAEPGP
jgi:hypothetical protein